ERCPLVSELKEADEAFITGTVNEVLAVTRIGEQKVGSGKPGRMTERLYRLFLDNVERRLTN
ncbi:MAG: aminotransferase IV, partial [Cloacibacillus sp.]